MNDAPAEIQRLLDVMAALRDPLSGCPWDRAQDFATIAPYTVEEAYEVADAIARRDWQGLPGELGDLLFQVVYHARLAEEAGLFRFADVAAAITDKMVRRHPHVFGDAAARDAGAAPGAWETAKARERAALLADPSAGAAPDAGVVLADVPLALPALSRAARITRRVAAVGFDWPDAPAVLDKLAEETAELHAELAEADPARLADEMGDMLFVMANLARKLGLDAETCLRQANDKFSRRFRGVERLLAADGRTPAEASLAEMEAAWQQVKRNEGGGQ
ncbi:MAG: nucleoside triphosphate pyrophosphohydrolase [Janthinobacterium lividum]